MSNSSITDAEESLSYKSSGVDIEQGNNLVNRIKPLAKATHGPNVLNCIGGFAGYYQVPNNYTNPVLVAGTDGVGTKLKLAQMLNNHSTIGIDLVAMCANDIVVSGAKPHFFLDYYACNTLDNDTAIDVITGITNACKHSGISLLGGETAEMPGLYRNKDYDLAGFCIGITDKEKLVNTANINEEDTIIGLSSSGIHSNGFSLVRKILETNQIDLTSRFTNDKTLGEVLLTPTVLYQNPLHQLIYNKKIIACAHITGGGLLENTARIIPKHLCAEFDLDDYQLPEIFSFLQQQGNIEQDELWRTFNCGIGMVLITNKANAKYILDYYQSYTFDQYNKTNAFIIGQIKPRDQNDNLAIFKNNY